MVLKFWNSSWYDLLAWILEEKRLVLLGPQSLWLPVSCFHQSVCVLWVLIWASISLPSDVPVSVYKMALRYCWTRESVSAYGLCDDGEGRACQGWSKAVCWNQWLVYVVWLIERDLVWRMFCRSYSESGTALFQAGRQVWECQADIQRQCGQMSFHGGVGWNEGGSHSVCKKKTKKLELKDGRVCVLGQRQTEWDWIFLVCHALFLSCGCLRFQSECWSRQ